MIIHKFLSCFVINIPKICTYFGFGCISQFIKCRSMYSQSKPQRRLLKGTENQSKLCIPACTMNTVITPEVIIFTIITYILSIIISFAIINIIRSDSYTKIDTIIEIKSNIKIILINATSLFLAIIGIRISYIRIKRKSGMIICIE